MAGSSMAQDDAATGTIRSVERAVTLLKAFRSTDKNLTLTELSVRVGLHKTTAFRLLMTLEAVGFVRKTSSGHFSLAAAVLQLGDVFKRSLRLDEHIMPALTRLTDLTAESAAFYVREGPLRRCIFRVDSPQTVRDHAAVGSTAPLPRGSYGRVLVAFGDDMTVPPPLPAVTRGEHNPHMSSIASPVFGIGRQLIGAVGLSIPTFRFDEALVPEWCEAVRAESIRLTLELGGDPDLLTMLKEPPPSPARKAASRAKTPPAGRRRSAG